MRLISGILFCLFSVAVVWAADLVTLSQVKTIQVAPLQGQDQAIANMLYAKLISALSKIDGITIVEDADKADAVLTLNGIGVSGNAGSGYMIQGGVRLVTEEGSQVLWADNIRSRQYAKSASSSFADHVAKNLERALEGKKARRER